MILADIFLICTQGDIIGIFGLNGSGKSTLLKIIFGSIKGDQCFVRINDQVQKRAAYRSQLIAYLPQDGFLVPELFLRECLELFIPKERRQLFFADKHLIKIRNSRVRDLSGGELRYFETKLLLWSSRPFVLLDEPFAGLSPIASESIRKEIKKASETKGIILTDHNFREVHQCVNRILLLDECVLKEVKDPTELRFYGYYEKMD